MKNWLRFVTLCVFAAGLGCATLSGESEESLDNALDLLQRSSRASMLVASRAKPAVVFITVEKTIQARGPGMQYNNPYDFFGEDFLERFFGRRGRQPQPREYRQVGLGSGFIISKDGYILTNNHVVGDADKITVRLHNGREYDAERIGTDPRSEVAVIKIDAEGDLPVLKAGCSAELQAGEWVMAVGNPFGLAETVTVGVVSATGRNNINIAEYEDFIQTDVSINPGNSGGPLLNTRGEVVGINTAIYSQTGADIGIGFAIPIDLALSIKDQLIAKGRVTRGYLGIQLNHEEISEDMAASFGLEEATGVLIAEVEPGTPAGEAGLEAGDIILEMDGTSLKSGSAFRNAIAMIEPGTTIKLHVFRAGETREIEVTIGTLPGDEPAEKQAMEVAGKLGLSVRDLTPELARRFGYTFDEGVIVDEVREDGPAARQGIQPGHVILSVNRAPVSNVGDFIQELATTAQQGHVLLRVLLRARNQRYVSWVLLHFE